MEKMNCTRCEELLPRTDEYFYKLKSSKDGLSRWCKNCYKENVVKNRKKNPEKYLGNMRKWYYNNKELNNQRSKEWHEKNKEKSKSLLSEWRRENKDKVKGYQMKRKNKLHDISDQEWESCRKYFDYCCAYCGVDEDDAKDIYNNYLHKEHVDDNGANDLSNCVPSCKGCNSSKRTYEFSYWFKNRSDTYTKERYDKIINWLNEDYKIYIREELLTQ